MTEPGTVLYIDDERQLPEGFEEALRDAGYRLLHTAEPDELLRLVRVEEIDLVLAEVVLASCNGIALLEEIRSYGGWPAQVPIVVLTKGERSPELYGGALEVGVKEFFTKPALKKELLESVRQFAGKVLASKDVAPSEQSSLPESEAAISGDLARIPISEVLLRLRRTAASGVLTVKKGKGRRAFELRNGAPVAASAGGGVEALEDYLVRRGRISQKHCRVVKERVRAGKGKSAEMLVVVGALSEQEFTAVVREQAEEQLFETFRWTSGAFHFFPDKHLRADVALEIDRGHAPLMLEGVRHWSPQEVAAEALRPRASLYVSKVEEPPCEASEIDLSAAERVYFEHLYGDRSVQEVLASGDLEVRTLYALFAAGLLVLHEEPVMMLLDVGPAEDEPLRFVDIKAPEPEEEFEEGLEEELEEDLDEESPLDPMPDFAEDARDVRGAAEATPASEPPPPEPAFEAPPPEPSPEPEFELPPHQPREPLKPAWNAEQALAELTTFCEQVRKEDDFDLLGITGESTDAEVRYAYEGLLDTLPDETAAAELPQLKGLAEEARRRIERAFARLGSSSSRKVCAQLRPQSTKGRKKSPAAKAAEKPTLIEDVPATGLGAEAWFRRGDDFLTAKAYGKAVEAYGMAAHLDPKEGEYFSRLGYAQFLHRPKDALVLKEALENVAKGIKLSPNREKPYIYLGKIFKENGAVDRARKMFNNAVLIKPDCHEALRELRLLDQSQTKPGKLIGRLKSILD